MVQAALLSSATEEAIAEISALTGLSFEGLTILLTAVNGNLNLAKELYFCNDAVQAQEPAAQELAAQELAAQEPGALEPAVTESAVTESAVPEPAALEPAAHRNRPRRNRPRRSHPLSLRMHMCKCSSHAGRQTRPRATRHLCSLSTSPR